jgi:hypothetical protein
MKNRTQILLLAAFLGGALTLPARGQQDSAQPGQEGTQTSTSSEAIQGTNNAEKFDPDDRPLSGAEDVSLGTPEGMKNVLNASIRGDERLDSNPRSAGNEYVWQGDGDVFGTLSLNRTWKRNMFTAAYDGGGIFYPGSNNQSVHSAALSQLLTWERWSLTFSDQMIYSPETPFGMPGPQPTSINPLGINTAFLPNQSILTNQTTRISNTSIVQADYAFSRRSSITATGSYGLLRYTGPGAFDSNQSGGTLGYNYALTPHDKVAVTYGYEQLTFNGFIGSNTDIQTTNLIYAHQVTGRWSAEIGAGAQMVKIFSSLTPSKDRLYPDGHANLTYAWRRSQLTLSASKSVMSGVGLFEATNTTIAQLTVSRALSRRLTGSIGGGYAENSILGASIGAGEKFRSGFANLSLQRSFGRHAALDFTYYFQRQTGLTFCSGPVCAGDVLRHSIGLGFSWNFSPVVFH